MNDKTASDLPPILEERLARLERWCKYISFLVWKLSLPGLAEQDPKYKIWMNRTYASTRENDFGVDDSKGVLP